MDHSAYLFAYDLPTYLIAITGALTIWFLLIGFPASWLLSRFVFSRRDPDTRASYSVAIVFLALALLYGLGGDPDFWFSKWEGLFFAPGALLTWLLLRWRFRKQANLNS